MNRKQLKSLWTQLSDEQSGVSAWQALSPQALLQIQEAVATAKAGLAYRTLETHFLRTVTSLAFVLAVTFGGILVSNDPSLGTAKGLAGAFVLVGASWLALCIVVGVTLGLLSEWATTHLTRLGDMLEPLSKSSFGCADAIKMLEDSPRCQAHQRKVVEDGREFLDADLSHMYRLARLDRADARERARREACQSLHMLNSLESAHV